MQKQLTSSLTFFFKFVVPTAWTALVLGLTGFIYWDSGDEWTFLMLMMILPMLPLVRIQSISFDHDFVFVGYGSNVDKYDLEKVKSINEGKLTSLDPFFELEIWGKNEEVITVDFIPKVGEHLEYQFTGKLSGRLRELKDMLQNGTAGNKMYKTWPAWCNSFWHSFTILHLQRRIVTASRAWHSFLIYQALLIGPRLIHKR